MARGVRVGLGAALGLGVRLGWMGESKTVLAERLPDVAASAASSSTTRMAHANKAVPLPGGGIGDFMTSSVGNERENDETRRLIHRKQAVMSSIYHHNRRMSMR
jgi:hypothetical protein